MLDIKYIRQNSQIVKDSCRAKQMEVDIDKLLELDEKKREYLQKIETIRQEKNRASESLKNKISKNEKNNIIRQMQEKDQEEEKIKPDLSRVEVEFNKLMLEIPNLPSPDVKIGQDASENEIIKKWGSPRKFDFTPSDHFTIGENLNLIDTKRAAKVSGSRFAYLKNEAVLLEFTIIQFTLETLVKEGFIPVVPPQMISDEAMQGMGYLAQGGEEETYYFPKDKLYLAGTAEQSIGPMHMNEFLQIQDLPKRYVGFSTCFRREAGSYGQDTRGIFRVHQFDKVEMFSFVRPQESDQEHEYLLSLEEKLVQSLSLPYQVVKMCSGDLGVPAARKYDIECWMPSQGRYRETHSTSSCTDFQARRLNIRFKDGANTKFVHTLNGTALAIGRTIIAILENFQQKDGSVLVPRILKKYIGLDKIGPKEK